MKKQLFTAVWIIFLACNSAWAVPGVTLSTVTTAAANIAQGTNSNIIYILKADVVTDPVTFNIITFTLTGTHDNNDLVNVNVYTNSAPTLTGATNAGAIVATFAAPHTYNITVSSAVAAGTTRYFIITANISASATHNNTIKVDGAANPVSFTYSVAPVLTNNQADVAGAQTIQAADVTYTSEAVPAANLAQGSTNNIVYILKADAATQNVTTSNILFTLTGTHDNNDLTNVNVYSNSTPTVTGAVNEGGLTATFAAPHLYTLNFNRVISAGTTRYFIITANVSNSGTHNNTIKLDGATNPVTINFTTSPNITNTQNDAAGVQTIQAADVSYTSVAVPAASLAQGSTNNIVYILKADAATQNVTTSNISFTLTGTHDNNDLTNLNVYGNSSPTLTGAVNEGGLTATFAAPHLYTLNFNRVISAGTTRYFIITANVSNSGTHNNTIKLDGATNPVTINFTTSPNITNTQNDVAGAQTIQAADVTYTSEAVPAANLAQGSTNNIVYILKADAATQNVTTSSILFTLTGTHDNNDLTSVNVYSNSSPTVTGAVNEGGLTATFAAPHLYTLNFSRVINAGTTRYFIITANISASGTLNNTIQLDGAVNPVTINFITSPNITNTQTNAAGVQTILASGVTYSSVAVAAGNVLQSTNNNILYILKTDVTSQNVTTSNISFTLSGTHDNNDLNGVNVYSNTAPTLTGATNLGGLTANFAAPHTYTLPTATTINAGTTRYLIFTANINATATHNNTIKVDGATNPVSITYATSPSITNNQTDAGGVQTIKAPAVTLSTPALPGGSVLPGEVNKIIYIAQADNELYAQNATGASFTVTGSFDNDDITQYRLYTNSTPDLTGATLLQSQLSGAAAPNNLSFSFTQALGATSTRYFILTATLSASATAGNTMEVNGATNPAVFSFSLGPVITNNQANNAGTFSIGNILPLTITSILAEETNGQVLVRWTTTTELNTKHYEIQHSSNGSSFKTIAVVNAAGNSTITKNYSGIHTAPNTGINYYRLLMMDQDGTYSFSKTVSVTIKEMDKVMQVFPNPASRQINTSFWFTGTGMVSGIIYNAAGERVSTIQMQAVNGRNSMPCNISSLAAGIYRLVISSNHIIIGSTTFIKTTN